ncbi:hypothetical protein OQ252_00575 [Acetobacter farinalis]|uniref:Uncharacterized protein n=1 Tax=Acetobacter farinalis TaxID=1260984 RepID=A0ABT3Q3P7_9PROT|nr:hypothetical protein [Acetobacter farinalis]MCX2559895.1 hypothetical protein [Acetobacter farinalis]NHO28556.1 hypothetical protein [Acetobacter farinalis]
MPEKTSSPTAAGSIARTVLKTLCTVVLTVLLIAALREGLHLLLWVDAKTGLHAGAGLLQILAADGDAKQEQVIAVGLMLLCFMLALVLVRWSERLLDRRR